ncbi:MAG: hypothetical protein NT154_20525 [Verrucomicrobia bacterium]|nr:hypothetical protein [Verrucomicrobiota bacterium]
MRRTEYFESQELTKIERKSEVGDAKGVIHTSPGQRAGFIGPKPHQR